MTRSACLSHLLVSIMLSSTFTFKMQMFCSETIKIFTKIKIHRRNMKSFCLNMKSFVQDITIFLTYNLHKNGKP